MGSLDGFFFKTKECLYLSSKKLEIVILKLLFLPHDIRLIKRTRPSEELENREVFYKGDSKNLVGFVQIFFR